MKLQIYISGMEVNKNLENGLNKPLEKDHLGSIQFLQLLESKKKKDQKNDLLTLDLYGNTKNSRVIEFSIPGMVYKTKNENFMLQVDKTTIDSFNFNRDEEFLNTKNGEIKFNNLKIIIKK